MDIFEIQASVNDSLQKILKKLRDDYLNTDQIIHKGKFKGRLGKVTAISIGQSYSDYQIEFMIQPYELERRGRETVMTDRLLWDHRHARTFWPIEGLNFGSQS